MRQLLFIATFCIVILSIHSCNRVPDLTKEEIYTILNEIIADDSLRIFEICATADDLKFSEEYGFSEEDKNFIQRQKKIFKTFKFEPNNLKFFLPRKKEFMFTKIDTSCNKGIVDHLSFPLISQDRQRVVFEKTEDCVNCMLGGQGGELLFLKKNGKWKFEKSFNWWVSQIQPAQLHKFNTKWD